MKHCGICPKCGVDKELTKHHIIPVRHGGRKGPIFFICLECHRNLEKMIPQKKEKGVMFYYKVVIEFLNRGK